MSLTIGPGELIGALRNLSSDPNYQSALDRVGALLPGDVTIPGPPGVGDMLPLPAANAAPLDPVAALQQIADAIKQASHVLDDQSLTVASATVVVDVNVKIPHTDSGVAARFTLQVGPKPYN